MKYFIDFEFIEGFHKPLFGKRRHFIDMISVGIACEDGRNYYTISSEYEFKDADKWVQENVIIPMYSTTVSGDAKNSWGADYFHKHFGLPNKMIAEDIVSFCYPEQSINFKKNKKEFLIRSQQYGWDGEQPEFYGYYCDYDWVLFCSLFGRMIDLPKGFPMYCKDLKQMLDEKLDKATFEYYGEEIKGAGKYENLEGKLKLTKARIDYPKQSNEHNALADAKWNKDLYNFIQTL